MSLEIILQKAEQTELFVRVSYRNFDIMETSLTIDYDKQWLNCVSAIGP